MLLLRVLALLHAAVSLTWFIAALVWPTRAVFFGAGTLVCTHVATGLCLSLVRVGRTWRYFSWAIAVTDLLGLIGIGVTLYNVLAARSIAAGSGASGLVQQLAHAIWVDAPALAVFVLVLLCVTAAVHVVVAATFLVVIHSRTCRARCHPRHGAMIEDDDDDADDDGADDADDADDEMRQQQQEAEDAARRSGVKRRRLPKGFYYTSGAAGATMSRL
jgi:hypothetical protein